MHVCMSFIRYKVTPRDILWLTHDLHHKVYELLMSILKTFNILLREFICIKELSEN